MNLHWLPKFCNALRTHRRCTEYRGQRFALRWWTDTTVSGAKRYQIKENRWPDYDAIELDRAAENAQLFQVVHVSRNTMADRTYTATGTPHDAFDLVKQPGNRPNEMIEHSPSGTRERTRENTIPYARPEEM